MTARPALSSPVTSDAETSARPRRMPRKAMKASASAEEEDPKTWTQERLAQTFAADRTTVTKWFTTEVNVHNGCNRLSSGHCELEHSDSDVAVGNHPIADYLAGLGGIEHFADQFLGRHGLHVVRRRV